MMASRVRRRRLPGSARRGVVLADRPEGALDVARRGRRRGRPRWARRPRASRSAIVSHLLRSCSVVLVSCHACAVDPLPRSISGSGAAADSIRVPRPLGHGAFCFGQRRRRSCGQASVSRRRPIVAVGCRRVPGSRRRPTAHSSGAVMPKSRRQPVGSRSSSTSSTVTTPRRWRCSSSMTGATVRLKSDILRTIGAEVPVGVDVGRIGPDHRRRGGATGSACDQRDRRTPIP